MAIRLSTNCTNCSNMSSSFMCEVHKVKVSESYTCEKFSVKANVSMESDCTSCARLNEDSCPFPDKASKGMLCKSWAPAVYQFNGSNA